jgi:hypothetical protein
MEEISPQRGGRMYKEDTESTEVRKGGKGEKREGDGVSRGEG